MLHCHQFCSLFSIIFDSRIRVSEIVVQSSSWCSWYALFNLHWTWYRSNYDNVNVNIQKENTLTLVNISVLFDDTCDLRTTLKCWSFTHKYSYTKCLGMKKMVYPKLSVEAKYEILPITKVSILLWARYLFNGNEIKSIGLANFIASTTNVVRLSSQNFLDMSLVPTMSWNSTISDKVKQNSQIKIGSQTLPLNKTKCNSMCNTKRNKSSWGSPNELE